MNQSQNNSHEAATSKQKNKGGRKKGCTPSELQAAAGMRNWSVFFVIRNSIGLLDRLTLMYKGCDRITNSAQDAVEMLKKVELQVDSEWRRQREEIIKAREEKKGKAS